MGGSNKTLFCGKFNSHYTFALASKSKRLPTPNFKIILLLKEGEQPDR